MRAIRRPEVEPPALATFRNARPDGTWEEARDARVNGPVFTALADAQGWVCAYCELRIEPGPRGQVEHFRPKAHSTAAENLHLAWDNLLAACEGGARPDVDGPDRRSEPPYPETIHCGALKADQDPRGRILDPSRDVPAWPSVWRIDSEGHIYLNEEACTTVDMDPALARSTIACLGLNRAVLRRLRRSVLSTLNRAIEDAAPLDDASLDDDAWERARVEITRAQLLPDNGRLPPFWTTILDWGGPGALPDLHRTLK